MGLHKSVFFIFFISKWRDTLFQVFVKFKCFPHCCDSPFVAGAVISLHVPHELTQMSQTCRDESLQGRAGYIIYTYCMYTIKLKALILSIVFNYVRFLMMKIDCTKFFFFYSLLVHVVARTYGTLWMVHQLLNPHSCSSRCKK